MIRPEDQPDGQGQDQFEEVTTSSVARREEMSPAAFTIDRHLAGLGFTENLPVLVQDLNYALGGNDFGDVNQTPSRVTYRFDPHRYAPGAEREEVYDYGPRVELTLSPKERGAVLKIGRIPQVVPDPGMSRWPESWLSNWNQGSRIASARLEDIQTFLQTVFPGRRASLFRQWVDFENDRAIRKEIDRDVSSLTQEDLDRFESTQYGGTPYFVRLDGAFDPRSGYDPFLVLGVSEHFVGVGPERPKERAFDIHALIYDTLKYNGSGADIEIILDGIRLLWAKDPTIEQWNVEYRQKAREIRERFLSHQEGRKDMVDVDVRTLDKIDLPSLKKILEMWVRWQGEIIPEEVEDDLDHIRESLSRYDKEQYVVAENATGRVVGMMGLAFEPKPEVKQHARTEKPMELVRAHVDKDFRGGKGVGRALISRIEALAKSSGATEILLDSGPRYKYTGHGFYDRMGYTRVAVNKDFYGPDGDAVVWSKVLLTQD